MTPPISCETPKVAKTRVADHPLGVFDRYRRQTERAIGVELDHRAAGPDGHQSTERRRSGEAGHGLDRTLELLLQLEAVDSGMREQRGHIGGDGGDRIGERFCVLDADNDAADVGAMGDVLRNQFHHHRKADFARARHRLALGLDNDRSDAEDAVEIQQSGAHFSAQPTGLSADLPAHGCHLGLELPAFGLARGGPSTGASGCALR